MKKMSNLVRAAILFTIFPILVLVPFIIERVRFRGPGPLWFYVSAMVPWGTSLVPMEKIHLTVVDSDGTPVEGALVRATFYPGIGKKRRAQKKYTDINGRATLKGKTLYCDVAIRIIKEEYYETATMLNYEDLSLQKPLRIKGGKWIPYGVEKSLVLKQKRSPVLLNHFVRWDVSVPQTDVPYGYDMEHGSLLAPLGQGKIADFFLTFSNEKVGDSTRRVLKMSFPSAEDGGYLTTLDRNSMLPGPYRAEVPNTKWRNSFCFDLLEGDKPEGSPVSSPFDSLRQNQCLVLRTRTQTDSTGKIIRAHYGMIFGKIGIKKSPTSFNGSLATLFFNSKRNDDNLEYDCNFIPPPF